VVKPAETTPDKSSVHISTQQDVSSPVAEQPSIPVSNTNLLPVEELDSTSTIPSQSPTSRLLDEWKTDLLLEFSSFRETLRQQMQQQNKQQL
jgi:hypothetical protein